VREVDVEMKFHSNIAAFFFSDCVKCQESVEIIKAWW